MATKIDENMGMVAMGVDDVTGEPRELLVDPVTGRLLVGIVIEAGFPGLLLQTKIDANFQAALLVVDDTTGEPRPLMVSPNTSALLVTIP